MLRQAIHPWVCYNQTSCERLSGEPLMRETPGYDILLFDGYFCDLIVTGLPEPPRLGADLFGSGMGITAGGTFNVVRAVHRLGMRVGWACDFGNDLFSQFVLAEVRKEGVETNLLRLHDRPVRSFSLSFSFSEDRGFISFSEPLERAPRLPYIEKYRPRAVLVHDLGDRSTLFEIGKAVRQQGGLLFLDCQSTNLDLNSPGVIEALRAVDVFLPNESEACQLTGACSAEQSAEILAAHTRLVVIKQGSCGALARTGDCLVRSPAFPVTVLDTTGAGDCFNAGFIFSYLRGDPLEMNLRYGNICGGLSTTGYGTDSTPTLAEVEQVIEKLESE
jgi:sugar/nucleoside kinase (ribokinase family)